MLSSRPWGVDPGEAEHSRSRKAGKRQSIKHLREISGFCLLGVCWQRSWILRVVSCSRHPVLLGPLAFGPCALWTIGRAVALAT
eukprot:5525879-Pyramimonas_sp.AAC.1